MRAMTDDEFDDFYASSAQRLVGLLFAMTGDLAEAQDAVQEAFVRAWQRLSTLKEPKGFGPWLVGIARNLSIDQRRKIGRSRTGALGEMDSPGAKVTTDSCISRPPDSAEPSAL